MDLAFFYFSFESIIEDNDNITTAYLEFEHRQNERTIRICN